MTTERTHLSIGEVLSLLQPEFPDITISKIRFLESQGLLDPERTPSGYRKFHDEDIERLRWILTQQRDHFLPLKVIKDRLAAGDLGSGTPEGVLPLAAESSNGGSPAPSDAARPTDSPDSAAIAKAASADRVPAETATARSKKASASADANPVDASDADAGAGPGHDRADAVGRLVEGPTEALDEASDQAMAQDATDGVGSAPVAKGGRRRHPTGHQPGAPTPDAVGAADVEELDPDNAVPVLTIEALVERSGLSAREIGELERYGLITGDTEDQVTTYGEEALVVARLASGFSRYGIEPRHLRMYKVAAEREAGLFEQLITPLLKQRRASARQQAVDMLEELAELADDLRAAMVRTALREYLGGS
jgi:DNA-binding transcriptional MerR regulator